MTSIYKGDISHTGYFSEEKVSSSPKFIGKYGLLNVNIHTACKSSAVVDNNIIYIGSDKGIFYAIDNTTLKPVWTFQVRPSSKFGIHSTASVDDKCVYFGAYDGWLYALDKNDGSLLWNSKLGDYIGASTTLYNDRLYVGVETNDPNGYLTCVDKYNGDIIYNSVKFGNHTHSTPTINPEKKLIFIGSNNCQLSALNLETGSLVWEFLTEGDIKSTPTIVNNQVLFTSWDNHLYSLNQDDGKPLFKFKTGRKTMSSPAVDTTNMNCYFGSHDNRIYCINLLQRELVWYYKTEDVVLSSATIVGQKDGNGKVILIGSYDGFLYMLDAGIGELIFKFNAQEKVSCVPTVKNGRIYFASNDGFLFVLE